MIRRIKTFLNVLGILFSDGAIAAIVQAKGDDVRSNLQSLRQQIKAEAIAARQTEDGLSSAVEALCQKLSAVQFHRKQLEILEDEVTRG